MILDKLENASLYNLSAGLQKGIDYLKSNDLNTIEAGKYDLGDGIKAIISEYNSKDHADAKAEAHEKMIDIQYIVKGEEYIGYAPLENQEPSIAYNPDKDVVFYKCETSLNKLTPDMFAIYYPSDIHQPGMKINESITIKKVVIKIPV